MNACRACNFEGCQPGTADIYRQVQGGIVLHNVITISGAEGDTISNVGVLGEGSTPTSPRFSTSMRPPYNAHPNQV